MIIPLIERKFNGYIDIATPYGFSGFATNGKWSDFEAIWDSAVKEKNYVSGYLGLHPLTENTSFFPLGTSSEARTVFILDLSKSVQDLFASLRGKGKKADSKLNREAVLVFDRKRLIDEFPLLYKEAMRRLGASSAYSFSEETLSLLLSSENVEVVGIEVDGIIQIIDVFLRAPLCAEYFLSASTEPGRSYSTALLWQGILVLKKLGCRYLNLGGGVRENDGLAQFKERFGGISMKFVALKQIYNLDVYNKLCRDAGICSKFNHYFPGYYGSNMRST